MFAQSRKSTASTKKTRPRDTDGAGWATGMTTQVAPMEPSRPVPARTRWVRQCNLYQCFRLFVFRLLPENVLGGPAGIGKVKNRAHMIIHLTTIFSYLPVGTSVRPSSASSVGNAPLITHVIGDRRWKQCSHKSYSSWPCKGE